MGVGHNQPPTAGQSSHPFRFVPVLPELAVTDTPVWHDSIAQTAAARGEGEELLSGELRCVLEAKTPLHVGWKQTKTTIQGCECSVSEPLTLGDGPNGEPGPVVIPGSTLNGMLRHSIGALLCAPMERVAERTFSYRPNAAITHPQAGEAFRRVAALVVERTPGPLSGDAKVVVQVLDDIANVRLCTTTAANRIRSKLGSGQVPCQIPDTAATRRQDRVLGFIKEKPGDQFTLTKGWVLARYAQGIDDFGRLAKLHAIKEKADPAKVPKYAAALVLVPQDARKVTLGRQLLSRHVRLIRHLHDAGDGHLKDHQLLRGEEKDAQTKALSERLDRHLGDTLSTGQVVFLEVRDTDAGLAVDTITETFMGRAPYNSTVHTKAGKVRRAVKPLEIETNPGEGEKSVPPQRLSAARLLFGFVGDQELRTDAIGLGHFGRTSGRISCNAAVEQVGANPRFLPGTPNQGDSTLVLRPQGSPKPSAVEHYVAQDHATRNKRADQGVLNTWGEGPSSGGDLAGRKFYLHQPRAVADRLCYEARDGFGEEQALLSNPRLTKHCPRLKFVSVPDTKFKFTVRFINLRHWELGALILGLSPSATDVRTVERAILGQSEPAAAFLAGPNHPNGRPALLHKLGRGRAYGLGSVAVTVRELCLIARGDNDQWAPKLSTSRVDVLRQTCVEALAARLAATLVTDQQKRDWAHRVLGNWIDVHAWRSNRTPQPGYPGLARNPAQFPDDTILYHNTVRQRHLERRKLHKAPGEPNRDARYGILPDPDW